MVRMKCPICKKDLGEETECDINTVGWNCNKCNIRIYKDTE